MKLPIGCECTLKFYFWKKIKMGPPYWIGPCNAFYVQKRVFRAWKPAKTSYLEVQMSVHIPSSHQLPWFTFGQIFYPDLKQKQKQRQNDVIFSYIFALYKSYNWQIKQKFEKVTHVGLVFIVSKVTKGLIPKRLYWP